MSKKINEEAILELFFADHKEHHVREVARLCRINPTTASKYLEQYAKERLLLRAEVRGDVVYSPNPENEEYRWRKRWWNLKRIRESGLPAYLDERYSYPAVVLFGSCAKGENTPASDIDLLIISPVTEPPRLEPFGKKLGAEIQVFLHTKQAFKRLAKGNPELANNMLNGVILAGYLEVF